jgi:hypothetical protein
MFQFSVSKPGRLVCLTAVAASLCFAGICLAGPTASATPAAAKKSPYPFYPELYDQARAVLSGTGDVKALAKNIDDELAKAVLPAAKSRDARLNQLMTLRGLAALAATAVKTERSALLLFLLDHPLYLSRFEHALSGTGKFEGGLAVLQTLRDYDPAKFEDYREFCIAFAAVWADFHGYWWADKTCGPVKPEAMLDLYKYFVTHPDQMFIRPWELPFELSEYVVHSRVTPEERLWVLQNYPKNQDAYAIYKGVPWTFVLSPAHGKGLGIDYTLMNMKKMGGVCMEQAYFTEQVFRLHGVPAVFMDGQGRRPGGHAWIGVFLLSPKPHWDFSAGRYEGDHYYSGGAPDPTNCHGINQLTEAQIQLTAAVFSQGNASLANIEKCYCYCAAADWVRRILPEKSDDAAAPGRDRLVLDLANEALKANPYNERVWSLTLAQAKDGKMTSEQAMEWAKKLSDATLDAFPDYTVAGIGAFLDCADKPDLKLELYEKLYTILSQKRPDLACNVKVAEGDIWLAKDNVKKALQCYVYPMVNFSKDGQILGLAAKKLQDVGAKGQADKAAQACREILVALQTGQTTPERQEAAEIIRRKLATLEKTSSDQPASSAPAKTSAAN